MEQIHTINNLSDVKRIIHCCIANKMGWERTKMRRDQICWIVEKDGMFGPRQIGISKYSPYKGVYLIAGQGASKYQRPYSAKTWPFNFYPSQENFKLRFAGLDVTQKFAEDLIGFVESSYQGFKNPPEIENVVHDKFSPSTLWTPSARELAV